MSNDNTPAMPASSHQPLDLAKFTLSSPTEIAQHLSNIAKHGHMVTVFANKGKNFILTRLLEVDYQPACSLSTGARRRKPTPRC